MKFIINSLVGAGSIYLIADAFEAISVSDFYTALLAGVVLAVISVTIKPILKILTIPLTLITFGLFSFVLNGVLLYLVAALVPEFEISTFIWAVFASLLVTLAISIVEKLLGLSK